MGGKQYMGGLIMIVVAIISLVGLMFAFWSLADKHC